MIHGNFTIVTKSNHVTNNLQKKRKAPYMIGEVSHPKNPLKWFYF